MEWNDKIELCTLLNNGNYEEAAEFIRNRDIDLQAMEMFIGFFDLTKFQVLQPIKDIILSYDGSKLSLRGSVRLKLLKKELKSL